MLGLMNSGTKLRKIPVNTRTTSASGTLLACLESNYGQKESDHLFEEMN